MTVRYIPKGKTRTKFKKIQRLQVALWKAIHNLSDEEWKAFLDSEYV